MYGNQASATMLGHERSKYGSVTLKNPEFMRSKEAFVGAVIQGAEQLYDRLRENNPVQGTTEEVDGSGASNSDICGEVDSSLTGEHDAKDADGTSASGGGGDAEL